MNLLLKDYYVSIFEEELNDEGEIVIGSAVFTRSEILRDLQPITYDTAFQEWFEDRKLRLKDKASYILSSNGNIGRFDKLLSVFKRGQVIPFVGAGMSIQSNYSGWTAFILDLTRESHIPEIEISELLEKGNYEKAAQLLFEDLGGNLFNDHISNEFECNNKSFGNILYLPDLFDEQMVITTNFDNILELIFKDTNKNFHAIKLGSHLAEIPRELAEGKKLLVKMHGSGGLVKDRVLTEDEYNRAYSDSKSYQGFIRKVLYRNTLLFLGCSLSIDRTIREMMKIVEEEGGDTLPRHYAFMELKSGDDRIMRNKELAKANIFPIWYDETEHDEAIEALFNHLLEVTM